MSIAPTAEALRFGIDHLTTTARLHHECIVDAQYGIGPAYAVPSLEMAEIHRRTAQMLGDCVAVLRAALPAEMRSS